METAWFDDPSPCAREKVQLAFWITFTAPLQSQDAAEKGNQAEPRIWPLDFGDINTQKEFLGRTTSMREAGALPS